MPPLCKSLFWASYPSGSRGGSYLTKKALLKQFDFFVFLPIHIHVLPPDSGEKVSRIIVFELKVAERQNVAFFCPLFKMFIGLLLKLLVSPCIIIEYCPMLPAHML